MSDADDKSWIWFERLPGFVINRAYMPVTSKGLYILLGFLVGMSALMVPLALLPLPTPWAIGIALVVIVVGILWFDSIAYRHSWPRNRQQPRRPLSLD